MGKQSYERCQHEPLPCADVPYGDEAPKRLKEHAWKANGGAAPSAFEALQRVRDQRLSSFDPFLAYPNARAGRSNQPPEPHADLVRTEWRRSGRSLRNAASAPIVCRPE
jgi:hypothetical protein